MSSRTFESDIVPTSAGDLEMVFLGHGSLMLKFAGKVIHVDPYHEVADYSLLPKADIIFITHEHGDHLDPLALEPIRTPATTVVLTETASRQLAGGTVMKNGDVLNLAGIHIEAIPAYNLVHLRENGQPFHPRDSGNGYILTFGSTRVYIAGDTENIPEMKGLKDIAIAFLPMNLPYTMTPEMVADAARTFIPSIIYPYHYGQTRPEALVELLKDSGIEVRIRALA